MKKILHLLLFFILLPCPLSGQNWQSIVKSNGELVCKIEIMDGPVTQEFGTGFLFDKSGRILTNAHVVSSANTDRNLTISLSFPFSPTPNKKYQAQIERFSSDLDLSVLKINSIFSKACQLGKAELPPLMSEVLILGFPLGKNFKSVPGFIQAYQDIPEIGNMIDMSAQVDPGNSGGPVFSSSGEVIGIVTSKYIGYNFNLAIPIANALGFVSGAVAPGPMVTSTPSEGRVFVNKTYKGLTPLKLEIYTKEYEIMVEKDGYEPLTKKITTVDTANSVENFKLLPLVSDSVKVTINTKPQGALVNIDNSDVGKTPVTIKGNKGGKLRIRTSLSGYKELYRELSLDNKPEQTFNLELEKAGLFW